MSPHLIIIFLFISPKVYQQRVAVAVGQAVGQVDLARVVERSAAGRSPAAGTAVPDWVVD